MPEYSREPDDGVGFTTSHDAAYGRFARVYDLAVKLLPVWKRWVRAALPHIDGARVLEVSFGTGYLLTQYAGRGETHGIDFNERMVRIARDNLARAGLPAQLGHASVEALPYADGAFDCVVNTMAFSGYPNGRRALGEIVRVLKPGGRLVLIDINYPANGNWVGTRMARIWVYTGDLLRDMHLLFREFALDFTDEEIGGFGSVHLYVATR